MTLLFIILTFIVLGYSGVSIKKITTKHKEKSPFMDNDVFCTIERINKALVENKKVGLSFAVLSIKRRTIMYIEKNVKNINILYTDTFSVDSVTVLIGLNIGYKNTIISNGYCSGGT